MKKINVLSLLAVFACVTTIIYAEKSTSYDPLKVHTYTLENGLTVYINEDHNTTSVFGAIAVRGGGKRDPEDARGAFGLEEGELVGREYV